MHPHAYLFFFLLVTTCSADSSDECCNAKIVGDVSFNLSRVITENDFNLDMASDCITKCLYRKTGSTSEFCFKLGALAVECKTMSSKAMYSNSQMITNTAIEAIQKPTTQFSKLTNFTTVKEKKDFVIWNFPDIPLLYNGTMAIFDAAFGNHTTTPNEKVLVDKARLYVEGIDKAIEFAAKGAPAAFAIEK